MNDTNQINNEAIRKSKILLVDDEPGLRTAVKTSVSYTHLTLPTKA